jgi:hypothetical protein
MADPPPEPIRYHLRTMKVLRPDRCGMPDGNRCSACTEDIALEQQFKELETSMEKIHIKRRALRTVMNQNHDRLIHRFPPEIASRIFFYYSLVSMCLDSYTKTNTLFLGAVCQKWRQLAWATPEVWTSIHIKQRKVILRWNSNAKSPPRQMVGTFGYSSVDYTPLLSVRRRFGGVLCGDGSVEQALGAVVVVLWYDIELDIPARYLHRLGGSLQKKYSTDSFSPPVPTAVAINRFLTI